MTRLLCACLAALLLLATGCAALAEERFDFSGMTLEELYEARTALDAAIEALEHPDEAHAYEDGVYLVGRDIPEGDYALLERDGAMFASVVIRAGEGEDSPLILHKLINGRAIVRLTRDTWVTLSDVCAWTLGAEPEREDAGGAIGDGAWLVGAELPAGKYMAAPVDKAPLSCFSVYADILGTNAKLTRFQVLHWEMEVMLEDGDYIEFSGCTLTPADQ